MMSLAPAFPYAMSRSLQSIAAFMPEPHILLMVVAPAEIGNPAPSVAWRAGAWPWPADRQLPKITSCTCSGFDPGTLDRRADGGSAELRRGEILEGSLERPHGGARRGDDYDGVV